MQKYLRGNLVLAVVSGRNNKKNLPLPDKHGKRSIPAFSSQAAMALKKAAHGESFGVAG